MFDISKYHKGRISKKRQKSYQELKNRYKLNLDPKSIEDHLFFSVFETSLLQKKQIETQYELFRNQHYDMWDYLNYKEKKHLFKTNHRSFFQSLLSFQSQKQNIYICFFNECYNHFYANETAILDLKQFFSLYDDFENIQIDVKYYGLNSLKSNFSFANFCGEDDNCVLYDEKLKQFYFFTKDNVFNVIPLSERRSYEKNEIRELSQALIKNDMALFLNILYEIDGMNRRCTRQYLKARKRGDL